MNKKNKYLYFIIVLIVILIIIGIYILSCRVNENVLRKEIKEVVSKDVDYDYKTDCKSRFGYCDIEEAIKAYMSEYSRRLKRIRNISKDEKISNVLTVNNYKTDGPLFKESLEYLDNSLKEYDTNVDMLIKMSDKKYLKNYIKLYTKDKKYIKLYKEIIDDLKVYDEVDNINELKANKINIDNTINTSIEILNFLKTNQKKWKIDNNLIKFNDHNLLTKYNLYLKKIGK